MVKDHVVTVIKMFLQAESSDEDDEEDEAPTRFFFYSADCFVHLFYNKNINDIYQQFIALTDN